MLRDDVFALTEQDRDSGHCDGLVASADEAHLDAAQQRIVNGIVLEAIAIEVGSELAIQAREQIQIELGRYAAAVVVGGVQHGCVLADVDADQERTARCSLREKLEQS